LSKGVAVAVVCTGWILYDVYVCGYRQPLMAEKAVSLEFVQPGHLWFNRRECYRRKSVAD
jgi:hypothetical protein